MNPEETSGAELSDVAALASQLREPDSESDALLTTFIESSESFDTLSDDLADSIMLKTLAWLHALDDESFEFGDIIHAFYTKHASAWRGSAVFNEAEEIVLERIQRTFIGVAHGIETTLPRPLRRCPDKAVFQITWTDEGGVGAWVYEESDAPVSLPIGPLVFQAVEVFGELEESDRELLATAMLEDLRAGILSLPGFELGSTPEEELLRKIFGKEGKLVPVGALRWKPPETKIDAKHDEAAKQDMNPESIGRLLEELERWASDATSAVKVDSQNIRVSISNLSESDVPTATTGIVAELDGILDCLNRGDTDAVKKGLLRIKNRLPAAPLPAQQPYRRSLSGWWRRKGEARTAQSSKAVGYRKM